MKIDKRIDEIRDERSEGGDFFVYLKTGFALSNPPQHCFGAVDRREIRETMKRVRRCYCEECSTGTTTDQRVRLDFLIARGVV